MFAAEDAMRRPDVPNRSRAPRRTAGLRFSRGSWLYLTSTILIGVVSIDTDANLLLILFGLLAGSAVVSLLAGWVSLRSVEVTRVAPDGVMAGQPFEVRYQITNRQRWLGVFSLQMTDAVESNGDPPAFEAFIPHLPAGRTVSLELLRSCPHRGRLDFNRVVLATRFPFGLITKFASVSIPQSTIVYPTLGTVRERRWRTRHWTDAAHDGRPMNRRGEDEFYGLREYRAGDNPRRIHWRRSARAGTLLVREMAQLGTNQIWCILDTRVPGADPMANDRLEEAISCTATVACDAIEANGSIGLIACGQPGIVLPPASGRDYRLRILRELAAIPRNNEARLLDHLRHIRWPTRWRGVCLIFAARANDDLADAARMLAGRIGSVTIYLPGTPAFDAIYSPRSTRRRAASRADLAALGSTAVLSSSGRLT